MPRIVLGMAFPFVKLFCRFVGGCIELRGVRTIDEIFEVTFARRRLSSQDLICALALFAKRSASPK